MIKVWLTAVSQDSHQALREEALRLISLILILAISMMLILAFGMLYFSNSSNSTILTQTLPILFFLLSIGFISATLVYYGRYTAAGLFIIFSGTLSANMLLLINNAVFPVASIGLEIMALTMAALTLPRHWHWSWVPVQVSLYTIVLIILNQTNEASLEAVMAIHDQATIATRLQVALSGIIIRICILVLEAFILGQLIRMFEKRIDIEVELRKEIEKNYQNSALLLQKATEHNRLKDQFFANVSHELNTPLNAMLGSSTLLVHDMVKDVNLQKEHLISINEASKRFQNIVQSLLNYNLADNDQIQVDIEQVDLCQLAQSAVRRFKTLATNKGLDLKLVTNPKYPIVLSTDPVKFSQIVDNLLDNAIKFTIAGEVTVAVYQDKIIVSDTGVGIPVEDQKYIFDPFQRAYLPGEWQQQGTGLGLYICKEFTQVLELELTCVSEIGKGTQMIIKYPLSSTIEESNDQELAYSSNDAKK